MMMIKLTDHSAILPSESAHYTHVDLSRITTELWETLVYFTADGAIILYLI